ncbi:glycosyltransferase family 2 protein [Pseudoxanthomonas koreensis]|uniref:glycosyltransferase family 2 protein n=1 Tax=Pseudoxanthomonas koreensis TaxID=266061 RepID=UPI0013917EC2|nr:glycosyltransferase family 2 protein [Pseudoxanthomonas koreensis]KAF1695303.1 hypothetical protein CSC64_03385 [Pseudoxanthomonas koreensis]
MRHLRQLKEHSSARGILSISKLLVQSNFGAWFQMKFIASVVIPCFNAARWISLAVDSAIKQDADGIEIVVVDDGSNDETQEILAGYGDKVTVIRQSNSGVSSARRNGVLHARGEYVQFLDADDLLPVGSLNRLLDVARRFPGEALIGRSLEIGCDGNVVGDAMYNIGYLPSHLEIVRPEFLLTQATHSSLWFLPRLSVPWTTLFDPRLSLGEEYWFCIGMISSGIPIRFADQVSFLARVHESPNRLSRSKDESRHLSQAALIDESVKFINAEIEGFSSEATAQIARLCWSRGRHCLRIGLEDAAKTYFSLAMEIDGDAVPVGSLPYKAACTIVGPRPTERAFEFLKRILPGRPPG